MGTMNTSSTSTSANQQMIKRIATRVKRSRLPSVASALAFTTVLALVPLLTVVFAILSMFPFFFEWRDEIETFLYSNLVPATGDAVKTYLQEFAGQAGTLTGLGLAALLLTALLLLSTIEDAFNDIWNISEGPHTLPTSTAVLGDADLRSRTNGHQPRTHDLFGFDGVKQVDSCGTGFGYASTTGTPDVLAGVGILSDVPDCAERYGKA